LITLGSARFSLGDVEGIEEIERGLAAGESLNAGESIVRGYKNLGDAVQRNGELERAADLHERGLGTARRLGDAWHVRWFSAELAYDRYLEGRWDEALALAEEVIAAVEAGTPHYMETHCRDTRALIRLARGDAAGAAADSERSVELGRSVADPQVLLPSLAVRARVLAERGDLRSAGELLVELEATSFVTRSLGTAEFAFAAVAAGRTPGVFTVAREVLSTPWIDAGEAVCRGDFARAADVYAEMGSLPNEANARRLSGVETQVRCALDFYRSVGATRYVSEAESLLASSA
jgi:MalT-like TPR region